MMDNRNLIIAIALSLAVLLGWQYFIAGPQIEKARQHELAQTQAPAAQPGGAPAGANPAPGETSAAGAGPAAPGAPAEAPAPRQPRVRPPPRLKAPVRRPPQLLPKPRRSRATRPCSRRHACRSQAARCPARSISAADGSTTSA